MPPVLKKKVGGLPMWAWLALGTIGVGVGLYLRSKHSDEEPTEAAGVPEGNAEEQPETSLPVTAGAEAGEFGGAGVGGPGGYGYADQEESGYGAYGGYTPVTTPSEEESAAQGGIVIEPPNVTFEPEINVNMPHASNVKTGGNKNKGKQEKETCKGKRPKAKKGYHVECNGNHWKQVPNAKSNGKKDPTKGMTGGGAPANKKHKTHQAKKKHHAKS